MLPHCDYATNTGGDNHPAKGMERQLARGWRQPLGGKAKPCRRDVHHLHYDRQDQNMLAANLLARDQIMQGDDHYHQHRQHHDPVRRASRQRQAPHR